MISKISTSLIAFLITLLIAIAFLFLKVNTYHDGYVLATNNKNVLVLKTSDYETIKNKKQLKTNTNLHLKYNNRFAEGEFTFLTLTTQNLQNGNLKILENQKPLLLFLF